MTLTDILLHLLNFVAPALALALLLPWLPRLLWKKSTPGLAWWAQIAINFVVGVAVLQGCLWWLGRDGKMAAYGLLVLVLASSQWVLSRAWRK